MCNRQFGPDEHFIYFKIGYLSLGHGGMASG
jgi:hypothetical protein